MLAYVTQLSGKATSVPAVDHSSRRHTCSRTGRSSLSLQSSSLSVRDLIGVFTVARGAAGADGGGHSHQVHWLWSRSGVCCSLHFQHCSVQLGVVPVGEACSRGGYVHNV